MKSGKEEVIVGGIRGTLIKGECGDTFVPGGPQPRERHHAAEQAADRARADQIASEFFKSRDAFNRAVELGDFPKCVGHDWHPWRGRGPAIYLRSQIAEWIARQREVVATFR